MNWYQTFFLYLIPLHQYQTSLNAYSSKPDIISDDEIASGLGNDLDDDYSANSSVWVQKTISLNSYRSVNAVHYIYFVAQGGSGFRADLAVDSVIIEEG